MRCWPRRPEVKPGRQGRPRRPRPARARRRGCGRCTSCGLARPRPARQGGQVIEAVVFDLDGVLVDSEPVWEQVRRQVVAANGGHWAPDAQQRNHRIPGRTGLRRATQGLDRLRGRRPGPRRHRQGTTGPLRGRRRPHHLGLRRPRARVHPPSRIPGHQSARPSSHPARRPGHDMDPRSHHEPPPGHTGGARLCRPPPAARTATATAPAPAVAGPA